ncbi:hypothetical protein HTZ77_32235 [Nonomuraea sp. SMC257]|uniref:Uncharacterized protein n=1 Tax=Nonomuraea montanisoli TaxID=2741721 RepID=A0A7Y6ID75_9ACTN|nr:hypothetical protein [Nonomuraea montanisoli]NUW36052.1 hypothetical protein [Nonomuraea montanisoli]
MDTSDGRVVLLLIILALALFVAGRRFQSMVSARQAWRNSMRAVPVKRQSNGGALKAVIVVALIIAVAFWFLTNANRMT